MITKNTGIVQKFLSRVGNLYVRFSSL